MFFPYQIDYIELKVNFKNVLLLFIDIYVVYFAIYKYFYECIEK